MGENICAFAVGDKVYQRKNGFGTVTSVDKEGGYPIEVLFFNGEVASFTENGNYYDEEDLGGVLMDGESYDPNELDMELAYLRPNSTTTGAGEEKVETHAPAAADATNPDYYRSGGIECIDAIRASMTTEEFHGFLKGNVQKYVWRYKLKNGIEDLKKAAWYLKRLISELEGKNG